MKTKLLALTFLIFLIVVPSNLRAADEPSESNFSVEDSGEDYYFDGDLTDVRSKHLGCVNSSTSCKKRAYQHGYAHYKIQQDFYCPKTICTAGNSEAGGPS